MQPSSFNSGELRKHMFAALGLNDKKVKGFAHHHLVPVSLADHPVIVKLKMNLDDASNGILLSANPSNPHHVGSHPGYIDAVEDALDRIGSDASQIADPIMSLRHMNNKVRELQRVAAANLYQGAEIAGPTGIIQRQWNAAFDQLY